MYKKRRPKSSKLSEAKFRQLVKYFCLDLTAADASRLLRVHPNTTNHHYQAFRELILKETQPKSLLSGKIEVDESYFGPTRIKGIRGRGAGKKTIVFGMFKRNGRVQTWVVDNCKIPTIVPLIDQTVMAGSTVYSDDLGTYRFLYVNYDHQVVYHGRGQFAEEGNHINGIESFWAYAKLRIRKFKGIRKNKFYLYLKETEWRYNNRRSDLQKQLLHLIKKHI